MRILGCQPLYAALGDRNVIATMRNLNAAAELKTIVSAEKLSVTITSLNVDDDVSVDSAINQVIAENGHIDVLVNNAGIGGGGPVEETPLTEFREKMETNFFGALRCIKAVVPGMARASGISATAQCRTAPRAI